MNEFTLGGVAIAFWVEFKLKLKFAVKGYSLAPLLEKVCSGFVKFMFI